MGTEVKRSGRETDHSPASSAEAKNEWSYISSPLYAFVVCWCRPYQAEVHVLRPGLAGFLCKCDVVEVAFGSVLSWAPRCEGMWVGAEVGFHAYLLLEP